MSKWRFDWRSFLIGVATVIGSLAVVAIMVIEPAKEPYALDWSNRDDFNANTGAYAYEIDAGDDAAAFGFVAGGVELLRCEYEETGREEFRLYWLTREGHGWLDTTIKDGVDMICGLTEAAYE